jgi:hypothetical protein
VQRERFCADRHFRGALLTRARARARSRIGALVAGVFAGNGFRVRILAPNVPMARRWLDEMVSHRGVLRNLGYGFRVSNRNHR